MTFSEEEKNWKRGENQRKYFSKNKQKGNNIYGGKFPLGKTSDSVRPCLLAWVEVAVTQEMCWSYFTI